MSRENIPDLNEQTEQAHSYSLRPDQTRIKTVMLPQHYITLKRKGTAKKSLITRKIYQVTQLITERGSRTKILYLKDKLNDVLRETDIMNEEMTVHDRRRHDIPFMTLYDIPFMTAEA